MSPSRTLRLLAILALLGAAAPACAPEPPAPPAPVPAEPDEEPDAAPEPEPEEPDEEPRAEPDRPEPDPEPETPDPEPREPQPEPREPAVGPERAESVHEHATRPGMPPVLTGSVLPAERIVAFYGNPRSERMGILGELPPDLLLERLDREVAAWERADPSTPVRPALHLITVMAAADPGPDSLYRVRMPTSVIEGVLALAERRDALVFLDVQPGRADVVEEARRLLPWLENPRVHLALDPEWNMGPDQLPGRVIGTMDASEINAVSRMLADFVEEHDLPPKILVVHRFTNGMVANVGRLELDPRVQLVLHMDGWGPPPTKVTSYRAHVAGEPVPFTGFKLFYRNDTREGSRLMTPIEVLSLDPPPIYIQYQ